MASWMIPALLLIALFVAAFLAWEFFWSRRGQQAIVEQHHVEGNDEPPKVF